MHQVLSEIWSDRGVLWEKEIRKERGAMEGAGIQTYPVSSDIDNNGVSKGKGRKKKKSKELSIVW